MVSHTFSFPSSSPMRQWLLPLAPGLNSHEKPLIKTLPTFPSPLCLTDLVSSTFSSSWTARAQGMYSPSLNSSLSSRSAHLGQATAFPDTMSFTRPLCETLLPFPVFPFEIPVALHGCLLPYFHLLQCSWTGLQANQHLHRHAVPTLTQHSPRGWQYQIRRTWPPTSSPFTFV